VNDLAAFDRHLAGVEIVARLDAAAIVEELEGTWQPEELVRAFRERVERTRSGRVRVERAVPRVREPILAWCVEQALRHGARLPSGLASTDEVAPRIEPSWIGDRALASLGELGLGDACMARVLSFVAHGRVTTGGSCELVSAARDLAAPEGPRDLPHLAVLAERAYRHVALLHAAAPEHLGVHLTRLASAPLEAPPIAAVLERHEDRDWLVLDALGLPISSAVVHELGVHLRGYRLGETSFAAVGPRTTTDAFHRELARAGIAHPFEKLDAIDEVLHEHAAPFEDIVRLATAALAAGLRRVRDRLRRPLLVTGDHGFVLAPDRRRFVHGGRSTLERIVPVLLFERE
jgi:hypothetical protein